MIETVDGYRLLECLGEGAAGKVFLAALTEQKTFGGRIGDLFAVKQYKKEFLKEKRQIERIEIELKVGSEISHPNIVRIFESSTEQVDAPYLVMEYIDGITLKDWIKMFEPIPEDWIYLVLDQIIDGIAELHSRDIEHRDIKPENIMLTADFTAKIMDLGVIQVPHKPGISGPGKLLGTIRNASPDVLKGNPYTPVDDIYSLGTVAYALLHGYQIFPEENTGQGLIEKVLKEKICFEDKTIKNRGKLCWELLSLTKRMMNKEQSKRPQKIQDVKESFVELMEKFEITDSKPMHGYIATALTGLEKNAREAVAFGSKLIADVCKLHNIYAHQPRKATDPILHKDIEPRKVYYFDRKRVLDSDLLIIIGNYPSFGVGQEIEIASDFGTPTILVVSEGVSVSRMVLGSFFNLVGDIIIYFTPEDLEKKLNKCLNDNVDKLKQAKTVRGKKDDYLLKGILAKSREKLGHSLEFVAQHVGISESLLETIENYPIQFHNCGYYILRKLCDFYEIELEDVVKTSQPAHKAISTDNNVIRLDVYAKSSKMSLEDYFHLRDEYLKEVAASEGTRILGEQDWRVRYKALMGRRLGPQGKLFS